MRRPGSATWTLSLAAAGIPARRLEGVGEALRLVRRYEAVIAPFAGGSMLPAAYVGANRFGKAFVLWASVWHQPRSLVHALSLPVTRHIYRHADAVAAYGEHVRRFVASIRGRDDDVFVAPKAVEEQFRRAVCDAEVGEFRERRALGDGPLVLYVGRVTETKGTDVLFAAASLVRDGAINRLLDDGQLRERLGAAARAGVAPYTYEAMADEHHADDEHHHHVTDREHPDVDHHHGAHPRP